MKIIKHCRKLIWLYKEAKKNQQRNFDVSIGNFDGVETWINWYLFTL